MDCFVSGSITPHYVFHMNMYSLSSVPKKQKLSHNKIPQYQVLVRTQSTEGEDTELSHMLLVKSKLVNHFGKLNDGIY